MLTIPRLVALALAVSFAAAPAVSAQSSWPMRQRDIHNTGRSDFVVPPSRLNSGLFSAIAWQTPTPGNPNDGSFSAGQLVYFDGAGPGGADLIVGSYHWPKGVQGMNRRTGQIYWSTNPAGGESIGANTAAFSLNGGTVYITNDATPAPLMAFSAAMGPGAFWSNAGSTDVDPGSWSPKVLPNGRVITSNWCDSSLAFTDNGSTLTRVLRAQDTCSCYPSAAAYQDGGLLRLFVASRCGFITCYDAGTGAQLWRTPVGTGTDAAITVDPASGNLFVGLGGDDISVAGLNRLGQAIWAGGVARPVFDWIDGVNERQRAQSAGALSHDGLTYYFQTVSQAGDGRLYAVNTSDGSVKWSYPTLSRGGEMQASSPIVTPNGVIFVGNNEGRRYFVIRDDGVAPTLIATFDNATGGARNGVASASATLAADGFLYLPVRTTWVYPYSGGPTPTGAAAHVFAAFDLRANPLILLPSPPSLRAFAGNASVRLSWQPVSVDPLAFAHYAVYRETAPFTTVLGRTPIATIPTMSQGQFTDTTAQNGVRYHYAVTTVAIGGGERQEVSSLGPRTPRDESDLQVVAIRRTPEFPRYDPQYTFYTVTEPGGFGPYHFTAATGLGSGQTGATQRWPNIGQPVTYTVTIRNRGTNPWTTGISGRWLVDGLQISTPSSGVTLAPGQSVTFALPQTWDGASHDVRFELLGSDARAGNNALTVNSKSVAFLSYIDQTYAENFREETPSYPHPYSDDMIDWVNNNMRRFNELFAAGGGGGGGGTAKRVHFGVLEMLDDAAPDPAVPTINYAVFPFRYRSTDGTIRLSGYYHPDDDIDYGLLHEMGHQLGLIDIYQFDMAPDNNQVNATGYTAVDCLMRGVSPFLSANSTGAMTHWLDKAHGYFGQYMYSLPSSVRMRFLGAGGGPLAGATVRVYQKVERPNVGPVITNQVKFSGTTDAQGYWTLPNVALDHSLVPTTFAGDSLPDNPFGYLAVVGTNGLLLFEVVHNGFTDYCWLDALECNVDYWAGQTGVQTHTRTLALGGTVQIWPPRDMAELNASSWQTWAAGASASATDDTARRVVGAGSVRFNTDGGFDTYARYPGGLASWDLSAVQQLRFWAYAENPNFAFQEHSPWVRLRTVGGLIDLKPTSDVLNSAIGHWVEFAVPLAGSALWERTITGSPTLTNVNSFEIHADTWGGGFTVWYDGVRFSPQPCAADFNNSGTVSVQDIFDFLAAYFASDSRADVNASGAVTVQDIFDYLLVYFAGCS
jgi:outer membrane protein assembly factor BamB